MARKSDPLARYNEMRDFAKTAEPKGAAGALPWGDGDGFMIQKHDATRLHYDLRLELDGTMKSWAVPNGPSLDPADKRLAIRTEDHPLSYATFEGTIPKTEYGGGTVMLWDRGTWKPDGDPHEGLKKGKLRFSVAGERMKGEWILFRLKKKPKERQESWMLRKIDDEHVGPSTGLTDRHLTSIKTGRTMAQIAAGKEADELATWKNPPPKGEGDRVAKRRGGGGSETRATPPPPPGSARRSPSPSRGGMPIFRPVQKATLVDHVPGGIGWIHEMKYDGYRCLLALGGGEARIHTRTGLDWTDKFPGIAAAAAKIEIGSALMDGEIVALDEQGRTGFSALQQAISAGGRGLSLFLFDALEIDGEDLTRLTNLQRKEKLAALIGTGLPPEILYAEHIIGEGEKLLRAMCEAGQEGIISKKADAPYRGARSKCWLKVKCTLRQEFVIVGWTESESKGRPFRSLLLAQRRGGEFVYSGKVGTGFSMDTLADLAARLRRIGRKTPPVEGVPRADAKGAHWVKPELVAEIAFAEYTGDGILRHPSFLGLREDKPAEEVVPETPAETPAEPADHGVKITNPGRVVFPDAEVTKGDLVAYHEAVGPLMGAWAANRPLSLVRCPQGRAKKCFFQKHNTGSFGPHVHQIAIEEKKGNVEDYVYVKDLAGLIACVQMGTIEFHGWGSTVADVEKPDRLIFDLDPDEGLSFDEVKKAARDLKRTLADMGLQTFCLLTGGKGLHVVVPLTPKAEWPAVKDFARRFAIALATAEPDRFTANLAKAKRKGRIFIDYLRNQRSATAILPYSARARAGAPVSAPIHWDELDETESGGRFTVRDAALLVERAQGLELRGWGEAAQVLPDL